MRLEEALKKYLGYETFRPGQKEVIETALAGKNSFVMLPTGTGKTVCYQLTGYLLEGAVVIISPLLSLMQDQVERMKAYGEKRVIAINSFLAPQEKVAALRRLDQYKFIFLSPEMLMNDTVKGRLKQLKIALFVIDEAHCISQWGHDFRPDYLALGDFRADFEYPLTMVLTATATERVRQDILLQLQLNDAESIIYSVDRPNIALFTRRYATFKEKKAGLVELVRELKSPGIIYFSSKRLAEEFQQLIRSETALESAYYHGDMQAESRMMIQQQFSRGQLDVICATSAFGMGIDKADIRYVIHFHLPGDLEAYVQEIGRAGRDGEKSAAILLYANGDEMLQRQLADKDALDPALLELPAELVGSLPETEQRMLAHYAESGLSKGAIRKRLEERRHWKQQNLAAMKGYLETEGCLRAYILRYFGEEAADKEQQPDCCDRDGAEITHYFGTNERRNEQPDWVRYLDELFVGP
ncbi:RecQ family ATP-dependent DNA helicase [Listeria costaricensis]|uniref:RecQ family ATP-dependent DNA helicase n=1 Tax=Listeria costaricensis TaxID=2026604 RepID=UPI000C07EC91|nr:ATP-dependent DNA helicase RecQ [Listeria costaricensis]